MKRNVTTLLGRLLFESGLARRRGPLAERGTVVAFHRVDDAYTEDGLTVGVEDFARFCRFFRDEFEVIPLAEMVRRCEREEDIGGALSITFDDGYLDNHENAAPVLAETGLTATFFITSGFIGSQTVPFWDRDLVPPPRWMDWDQVRELRRAGHEIGAHTRTHADLGRITGEDARDELAGSRAEIEHELGEPIELFAYPFGGLDNFAPENRALVLDAGFRCCVSCHGGSVPPGADPYDLRRVPISRWYDSPWQLGFAVATGRA